MGDGDLSARVGAALGCASVFRSADPREVRCLVEPLPGGAPDVHEWLVRELPRSERSTDSGNTMDRPSAPGIHRGGLEVQLDAMLGLHKAVRSEDSPADGTVGPHSDDDAHVLDVLYDHIPRYTADQTPQTILHGLMTKHAASREPSLALLRGVVETSDGTELAVFEYERQSLQDLLKFNLFLLDDESGQDATVSDMKRRFIVYQLWELTSFLHDHGLCWNEALTPGQIWLSDGKWIRLGSVPQTVATVRPTAQERHESPLLSVEQVTKSSPTERWCRGDISNYEYLMLLNDAAGRRMIDSVFHPVFPWVSDFSSRQGGWRDLSKSKFRLNKGDNQLDRNYESSVIPHHITESLSEITFYIYMARRTPMAVLRQIVRSNFQPKEYPSTLERMFHWTPDECIPEFFSDASVFASVHGDSIMSDLVLPDWCENGHDFVRAHRSMLESEEVSSSLHKWIDLNFGVCLSGEDAVRNKNVPLRTKLGVGNVQKSPGFVQIFREAHPRHRRSNVCKGSDPVFEVQEGVLLSGPRHHNPETLTVSLQDGGASLQSALQIAEDAMAESSFPPAIDYPQHGQLQGMLLSPAQSEKKSLSSSFVKLKKKHKARPKLQPGSDASLVSPPAARETAQSRSPTVARFAHAIPKFFGADSPSHHSGVSPDHTSSITATTVANTMSQAHSASYSGPGSDFGRPATHSRTASGSLPTHSLPPTILNSSIGAHASPGTHIFRDLWHQLSKPDDEESNETTEDGNSLSDSEWAGLDFDTLDDTSLSLLRACPTISLTDDSSHLDHQHRDASGIAHSIDSIYKLPDGWNAMTAREDDLHHSDTALSADLFSIGCIMAEIYTIQPLFSSTSVTNYCNSYSRECGSARKPSWSAKCIVEEQLRPVPIDIKNVILDLVHPHPRHRISAWRARRLISSDGPLDWTPYDMYLPCSSPIFPPGFSVVYKYSAQLHGAKNWWDRLAITRKYLPAIIRLPDDAFHVALPSLLSFFKSKGYTDGVNTAQVCSATVFLLDSLANRIGRAATRRELLDVLLRVYESSDLPPVLKLSMVTPEVLKTITTAFGPVKMLRHFFPAILDWLSAPPAYRSKQGVDVYDGRKTRPSPLFSSESANMLAVSVGELASSDYLGSALAVKFMLPALLPQIGKIHPKWIRLTDERSLVREDSRPSSGTFERRSAYGGKHGDGIHVAYAPKHVLYENHYVAEAILLVCRELPPSVVCGSLLPHLCDIVPRLVDVAESVSSARVDGVPDELAREVYVAFRVLRNVVRSISEQAVQRDFLQKRASTLIDLINRIQPPFLHPRTVDAVLSTIKGPSRTNSSERPVLVRHNSAPVAAPSRRSKQIVDQLLRFQNEQAQDLRAFTAVGVARTVTGALQRVGADAAIDSTGILQSIDAFLMRCAAIYAELEVSDFQWRMASEVVSEFCSPLRALLGSEAFGKFFPSVQASSVLQMLLLPNAQAQADQDRPRSKNAKQYLRQTTVATDHVVGDEDIASDHAEVATLASHVPDLLQACYRSARLNGIKTASFLHVSLRSGSAWSHDMNEAIFLVQEERKKRRLASTSNKAGGNSAWLRPRVESYFFARQEDPTRTTTMSGSSDQLGEIGRSWSMRGEVRHTIRAHSSCTRAIHVDQDEDLVVSASKNGSCRVWRLASYPSQATSTVHFDSTNVLSARSLEDGKRAVAMSSTSVHVWDVRTSQVMFQIPFAEEGVTSWTPLCMLPFKHYRSFSQSSQKIQTHEASVLQGNADFAVTTVRKLLLVDARAAPRIVADWRVDSRDTTYVCATALISTPSNAVGLIATGTTSGQIFLTDKRTGKCVSQWQALHDSRIVKIVQYAPSYILVVGSDREARVWNISHETHPRLRMVVTNVPEGVRETQVSVQAYADSVLLYVAASAKLYTTRLIHDASPEARRSDVPAVRLESWSLVDNMPGTGTGFGAMTISASDRSAGANSPERSRLHRTKLSAQSMAVLPLRQVVLIGGEDGSLRTCV